MINNKMFLNPKIFDADVEKSATRDGFGHGLVTLGNKNESVVVLCADLTESTRAESFKKSFPERFIECGVAEQNMAAIASGMAIAGKIPFVSSYAAFSPGKNWETIRTTIMYNNANVKIAAHHAGIATGPDGVTHQATEDLASVRSWPNLNIQIPCDSIEAKKSTIYAGNNQGPYYLRFSKPNTPIITTEKTPFDGVTAYSYWITDKPQATIFASGYMVYYALLAAKALTAANVFVDVVNVTCLKPLDTLSILNSINKSRAIVTVEDHQISGGLGGAISELCAANNPVPIEFVGLRNTFAESGNLDELLIKYSMDKNSIIKAVNKVIKRK